MLSRLPRSRLSTGRSLSPPPHISRHLAGSSTATNLRYAEAPAPPDWIPYIVPLPQDEFGDLSFSTGYGNINTAGPAPGNFGQMPSTGVQSGGVDEDVWPPGAVGVASEPGYDFVPATPDDCPSNEWLQNPGYLGECRRNLLLIWQALLTPTTQIT
jgi:hypothetical protein